MTIGETLKRARKKMGLELDDVVRSTKIAKMFLIALENDDISSLPKGVYTRNFLRTYARFLKLDEDILTTEYHDQYAIKPHFVTQQEQTKLDNQHFVRQRNRRMFIITLCILVPVCLGLIYFEFKDPLTSFFTGLLQIEQQPLETTQPIELPKTLKSGQTMGNQEEKSEPSVIQQPVEDPSAKDERPVPTEDEQRKSSEEVTPPDNTDTVTGSQSEVDQNQVNGTAEEPRETDVSEETEELSLPIENLDGVIFYPETLTPKSIDDIFAIEGVGDDVWLQVYIDGVEVSNRKLAHGQVRHYCYGQQNKVIIGDANLVAVQDGRRFRAHADKRRAYVSAEFGPGGFFKALDEAVTREIERARAAQEEQQ